MGNIRTSRLAATHNCDYFEAIAFLDQRLLPKLTMENFAVIFHRHQARIHAN